MMKKIEEMNVRILKDKEAQSINGGGLVFALLGIAGAGFMFGWSLGREYAKDK